MDVNAYTLSLIDNYIAATEQGTLRRSTLSPADYLLFRKQAVEECQNPFPVTMVTPDVLPQPAVAPKPSATPKPVANISKPKEMPKTIAPSYDDYEDYYEEEEENDLESLLKSIPG